MPKFEPGRIKSPEELMNPGGGDAGAGPLGCDYNNRHYKDGDTRRGGPGKQFRCTNGVWVEESLLDPTDPWNP